MFTASVEAAAASEVQETPDFSLMVPDTKVWMRYATRQHDSSTGEAWMKVFKVLVKCHGHVRETDMGCLGGMDPFDPKGRGWWCYHDDVMKFLLGTES